METKPARIIAFVGMPGAGKTKAASYLKEKGIPFVRFGDITDLGLKEQGLPITPENERIFREQIRSQLGMAAYAIKSLPAIEQLLLTHSVIGIDGLYSFEEYLFLKEKYEELLLVHVFAPPSVRYQRLAERPVRPIPLQEARSRDIAEIQKLNKGGTIALSDFLIDNSSDDIAALYKQIDSFIFVFGQ